MSLDLQSLNLWFGIVASIATTVGIAIGWLLTIGRTINARFDRADAEVERIERETRLAIQACEARAKMGEEDLRRQIEAHRLYAAEHFATEEGVSKAIEPLLKAIEKVSDRLDQLLAGDRPAPRSRTPR